MTIYNDRRCQQQNDTMKTALDKYRDQFQREENDMRRELKRSSGYESFKFVRYYRVEDTLL